MNAAITVEILLQAFDVRGVVHCGIAGGTDTSLNVGDVGVAIYFAFTSSWKWTVREMTSSSTKHFCIKHATTICEFRLSRVCGDSDTDNLDYANGVAVCVIFITNVMKFFLCHGLTQQFGSTDRGELKFGAYNLPSAGGNLLAELQFTPVQLFSNGKAMEELFWLPVDPHWYQLATQLKVCMVYEHELNANSSMNSNLEKLHRSSIS